MRGIYKRRRTAGEIGNSAVNSGNISSGQVSQNHLASGTLPLLGYIYGFNLVWVNSGQIIIRSGIAADQSGGVLLGFNNNQTITLSGTNNGPLSTDISPIGNVSITTSGTLVSGNNFFQIWPIRTGTGLLAFSGTNAIVGSGGDVLNQCFPGDLIGSSGQSFWQVTTVNSGTITTSISGSLTSGSVFQVIENAFFATSGQNSQQINNILSGSLLNLVSVPFVSGNAIPGFIGTLPNSSGGAQSNLMVWLGQGLSGTTTWISTQRTTPLLSGIVGYTNAYRRIGSLIYNGFSGTIEQFSQIAAGNYREYDFEINQGVNVLVNIGAATAYAALSCTTILPPTANGPIINMENAASGNSVTLSVRRRNTGDSAVTRANRVVSQSGNNVTVTTFVPWDGQAIDYVNSTTGGTASIRVIGYKETL